MYKIIVKANKEYIIYANKNDTLLNVLRENVIGISSPCNGNRTCGKCRVRIISGKLPEAFENEIKLIGSAAINEGYRLACLYLITSDLEIEIALEMSSAQIMTEGVQRKVTLNPVITKNYITVDRPTLSSQVDDASQITKLFGKNAQLPINILRLLPYILRRQDFNITLIKNISNIIGIEAGDTTQKMYGMAVDIGTTTIAAYLIDLNTGEHAGVRSQLNPQRVYGADIISRIKYTIDNPNGLDELHQLIISAINSCTEALCKQARINSNDIYAITFVGNTTMQHLLINVSARHIATAPFIPAFTSIQMVSAAELGLEINQFGVAYLLPSVSAYIGADTVGAVLSTGLHQANVICLLIDIGTNGEIVLGNKDEMYACSSAAGPAFEGANMRNGIGSISGAINSVSLENGLSLTTIDDMAPIGICGTGVVDSIAQLLKVGIVDETGRIHDEWEPRTLQQQSLVNNIKMVDGMNTFFLTENIAITQKDIRELQFAKAAISAGINVLTEQAGVFFEDIKHVYLAGGFGSYINIDNALRIGLIPPQLKGKIKAVGNAAGQGAVEALISVNSLEQAIDISKKINYTELSDSKAFNDYYIDCMMFE